PCVTPVHRANANSIAGSGAPRDRPPADGNEAATLDATADIGELPTAPTIGSTQERPPPAPRRLENRHVRRPEPPARPALAADPAGGSRPARLAAGIVGAVGSAGQLLLGPLTQGAIDAAGRVAGSHGAGLLVQPVSPPALPLSRYAPPRP